MDVQTATIKFLRNMRGKCYVLDPRIRQEWVVGRSPAVEIFAGTYRYTSRRHCAFIYRKGNYFLRDLETSNGTFVGERRIEDEYELSSGDVISIGGPATHVAARLVLHFSTREDGFEVIDLDDDDDNNSDDDVIFLDSPEPQQEPPAAVNDVTVKLEYSTLEEPIELNEDDYREVTNSSRDIELIEISDEEEEGEEPGEPPAEEEEIDESEEFLRMMEAFLKQTAEEPEPSTETNDPPEELSSSQLVRTYDALEADLLSQTPVASTSSASSPSCSTAPTRPPPPPSPSSSLFPLADSCYDDPRPSPSSPKPSGPSTSTTMHSSSESEDEDDSPPQSPAHSPPPPSPPRSLIMPPPLIPAQRQEKKRRGKKKKMVEEEKQFISPRSKKSIKEARREKLRELALAQASKKTEEEEPRKHAPVKIKITNRNRAMIVTDESEEPPALPNKRKASKSPPPHKLSKKTDLEPRRDPIDATGDVPSPSNGIRSCLKRSNGSSSNNCSNGGVRSVGFDETKNDIRAFPVDEGNCLKKIRTERRAHKTGSEILTDLIFDITCWNALWLDESKTISELPPLIKSLKLIQLPCRFKNHYQYFGLYRPLLLLELWTIMSKRWKRIEPNRFPVAVTSLKKNSSHRELITINCQALVRMNETGCVRRHDLVVIFLNVAGSNAHPVIGIVDQVELAPINEHQLHSCLRSRSREDSNRELMRITIVTKYRDLDLDLTDVMVLKVIGPFKSQMRTFEVISTISASPLKSLVLNPLTIKQLPPPANESVVFRAEMDETKKKILLRLTAACLKHEPLLQVVYGPPGSGKTQLAMALVMQLMKPRKSEESPRIVVCFPQLPPMDRFYADLRGHRNVYAETSSHSFSIFLYDGGTLRRRPSLEGENDWSPDGAFLDEADVIICTVSDCGGTKLRTTLASGSRRVICLMDEAGLSFEPESSVPLLLRTEHLILFGDVKQNQTQVYGKNAAKSGLRRSLFHRIIDAHRAAPGESPLCHLTVQYRMNPPIARLAADFGSILPTQMEDARNLTMTRYSRLKPTSMLVRSCVGPSFLDTFGVIHTIIGIVRDYEPKLKVAILTANNQLNDLLRTRITHGEKLSIQYFASYRGREADIVIFVTMATGGDVPMLKEADFLFILTRARFSFIYITDNACLRSRSIIAAMNLTMQPRTS